MSQPAKGRTLKHPRAVSRQGMCSDTSRGGCERSTWNVPCGCRAALAGCGSVALRVKYACRSLSLKRALGNSPGKLQNMFGTITTTLRPLKFAFLVHPSDRSGLRLALELSTLLWGGQFNPIIPTYRRLPAGWRRTGGFSTARAVFRGYIEAFDPDYVVPVGRISEPPFPVGHRSVVSPQAVLGEFEETGILGYGIGIFDVLRHFRRRGASVLPDAFP